MTYGFQPPRGMSPGFRGPAGMWGGYSPAPQGAFPGMWMPSSMDPLQYGMVQNPYDPFTTPFSQQLGGTTIGRAPKPRLKSVTRGQKSSSDDEDEIRRKELDSLLLRTVLNQISGGGGMRGGIRTGPLTRNGRFYNPSGRAFMSQSFATPSLPFRNSLGGYDNLTPGMSPIPSA